MLCISKIHQGIDSRWLIARRSPSYSYARDPADGTRGPMVINWFEELEQLVPTQ